MRFAFLFTTLVMGCARAQGGAEPEVSDAPQECLQPDGAVDRSCLGLPREPVAAPSTPTDPNLLGQALQPCSVSPVTGFYRDGSCRTGPTDRGVHVVCAQVDAAFLEYSRSRGNDLITPAPRYNFPGLKPGDQWCLCAARWEEARQVGKAPPVVLEATHQRAGDIVDIQQLRAHAVDKR